MDSTKGPGENPETNRIFYVTKEDIPSKTISNYKEKLLKPINYLNYHRDGPPYFFRGENYDTIEELEKAKMFSSPWIY